MKVDEDKIREACTRNPEEGFRMLVDQFQQPMYWHIRRMVVSHEDAEDVLQETFIRIFRYIGDFRSESSLSTWIYRIVTNECIRFLNKKKEEILSSEEVQEDLLNKLMASDYVDYENEMEVKFQQAVLRLPEKQRVVFNLRYYDELSYEEISKITDSKVETLKANYHFAKEKIKEYMIYQIWLIIF
jgi:RNA polymerase sigma-70 factor (ECF subfamily)